MAFGQAPGPPATARQREELLMLLQAAGHTDFRDARGPMGFNQRQAGGRFTRVEAEELITRLQEEGSEEAAPPELGRELIGRDPVQRTGRRCRPRRRWARFTGRGRGWTVERKG
jgi:hypothetical protein